MADLETKPRGAGRLARLLVYALSLSFVALASGGYLSAQPAFPFYQDAAGYVHFKFPVLGQAGSAVFDPVQWAADGSGVARYGHPADVWDGTDADVGPAINGAITAACRNGGGRVPLPPGSFSFQTPITVNCNAVQLVGAGEGNIGLAGTPTKLNYTGGVIAGPALYFNNQTTAINNLVIEGFSINCNDLVGVCVQIQEVENSKFHFQQFEATNVGILLTTNPTGASGTQLNDFWIRAINVSSSGNLATGIVLDRLASTSSAVNVSANIFHVLGSKTAKGDSIVVANADANLFETVLPTHATTSVIGSPFLCLSSAGVAATSAYTTPSGYQTSGTGGCVDNIWTNPAGPIQFQGLTENSVFTAVTHTGSAALAPVTIVTNAPTASNSNVLNFASTTGVVVGASGNCGGAASGIYPNFTVTAVSGTTVTADVAATNSIGWNGVLTGTSCTFSYRITDAAAQGTPTNTATITSNGATYTIAFAAGGHPQSGISPAGGALTFTDLVLPWTGTANNGDTWTVQWGLPSRGNIMVKVDQDSTIGPGAYCSSGATGQLPVTLGGNQYGNGHCRFGFLGATYTVATLPACTSKNVNTSVTVTDLTAPAFGAAPAGGGNVTGHVTCQNAGAGWKLL